MTDSFQPGDRVAHIRLGDGIVTKIDENGVHVHYDGWPAGAGAIYDRRWFELHPKYLFHRSAPQDSRDE